MLCFLLVQIPNNFHEPTHTCIKLALIDCNLFDEKMKILFNSQPQENILTPMQYYNILLPHTSSIDLWETTFYHQLFEKTNQYDKAVNNYLQMISINSEDILVDDAHYFLAELYLNKLHLIDKAKEYYQKIIFEYPSSIYLVDARKKFRKLRGDELN